MGYYIQDVSFINLSLHFWRCEEGPDGFEIEGEGEEEEGEEEDVPIDFGFGFSYHIEFNIITRVWVNQRGSGLLLLNKLYCFRYHRGRFLHHILCIYL